MNTATPYRQGGRPAPHHTFPEAHVSDGTARVAVTGPGAPADVCSFRPAAKKKEAGYGKRCRNGHQEEKARSTHSERRGTYWKSPGRGNAPGDARKMALRGPPEGFI